MKKNMNRMKYIAIPVLAVMLAVSCDEFPPVNYDDPQPYKVYTDEDFAGSRLVTECISRMRQGPSN